MNEFRRGQQFRGLCNLFFKPVFNGFYIVIGDGLDFLDSGCGGMVKFAHDAFQHGVGLAGKGFDFGKSGFG